MKKNVLEFFRRGLIACGIGPIILAVVYLVLQHNGAVHTLTVNQVSCGIFSITALAFVAGGMNVLYQIEQLPLMVAIFIHGVVLYIAYIATYLVNKWLEWSKLPILVFSGIFVVGYLIIWAIIYIIMKKRTERLNVLLKKKQHMAEEK